MNAGIAVAMKPELTAQEQTTASGQQNAGGQDPNQAAADAYRQAPAAAAAASRTAQDCETGQCVAEEEDPMKPETFTAPLRGPLPDPTIVIEVRTHSGLSRTMMRQKLTRPARGSSVIDADGSIARPGFRRSSFSLFKSHTMIRKPRRRQRPREEHTSKALCCFRRRQSRPPAAFASGSTVAQRRRRCSGIARSRVRSPSSRSSSRSSETMLPPVRV